MFIKGHSTNAMFIRVRLMWQLPKRVGRKERYRKYFINEIMSKPAVLSRITDIRKTDPSKCIRGFDTSHSHH